MHIGAAGGWAGAMVLDDVRIATNLRSKRELQFAMFDPWIKGWES
jgi:hypothetical protein